MAQLATALYGRLILDRDGAMLVFCNAGHLPPVLRRPDGTTALLEGAVSPLIGAPLPSPVPRTEAGVVLPSGSTLLLFTDGLVERRNDHLDDGMQRVRTVLSEAPADAGPEELCDRVLEQVLEQPSDDDVAVLAVRIS